MTPIQTPTPYGGHVWGYMAAHTSILRHQETGILIVTSSVSTDVSGGAPAPTRYRINPP